MVKLVLKNKQLICLSREKVAFKNVDEINPWQQKLAADLS
jgi:hypothetical protein